MNSDNTVPKDSLNYQFFRMTCLQYMTEEEFAQFEKKIQHLHYKRGELITKQSAQATHIYYLNKGMVKHYFEDDNKKRLILAVNTPPHVIGLANMFNEKVNMSSVAAVEDCEAFLIEIGSFEEVARKSSEFLISIFKLAADTFSSSIFNFMSLAHKHINGRVADILIHLSTNIYKQPKFVLSLTRKELSEFAGASQENVIMTLSKFKKEGIINLNGKEIEIVDMDRLKYISKIG